MSWQLARASVNYFLLNAIESTFLHQSESNLLEVLLGIISRMSSIMSEIRLVTLELLALKDRILLFLTF